MPHVMHLVSLQQAAGVEAHFAEFVVRAVQRRPGWTHGWINPAAFMHAFFQASLAQALSGTVKAKYGWGIKLPARPRFVRTRHCRRALAKLGTDLTMIWNRTARNACVVDAVGAENCIHWEHGEAWFLGHEHERGRYLRSVPLAITNSKASARVLELVWDYSGRLKVCRNALRPSLLPPEPLHKTFPDRRLRLGAAARLVPVKGITQILLALKLLLDRGMDVELKIAGDGPERESLQALAQHLGVAGACRFLGSLRSMEAFYRDIDCLLHVPVTEAFGLVAIEAAAHGCPVIAAAVDGLPEAVQHGAHGRCLEPTLPLPSSPSAALHGIPEHVYDPAGDCLVAPKLVDPSLLAAAVDTLFADPGRFETMSRAASEHVRDAYDFDTHVDAVMQVVGDFITAR